MIKSNKQDTFLIGHARRMRECRKRQRQQNPEVYRNRVNFQQKQYRLRTRSKVLSEHEITKKLQSIIKARTANRQRQRRYRLNRSNEKKLLQQEKDRNYRRSKRKQQQLDHSIENVKNQIPILYTIPELTTNSESSKIFFYRLQLKPDS
jgi:hypothetical protein